MKRFNIKKALQLNTINVGHESKSKNLTSRWNQDRGLRLSTANSLRCSHISKTKMMQEGANFCYSPNYAQI